MQIGQILVEQRWVEPAALARALAEQRHTGKRICSLLIARGLLDPDHASRALATQHNAAGALQRHLEHRDPALAQLLAAPIARSCFALPIGRTRTGELIVCVRDPRPELHGLIAAAVGGPIVMAVAPASQLEQLIKQTYDGMPDRLAGVPEDSGDSYDVDLTTRPIETIPEGMDGELGGLGSLGSMTLVGLDDHRVAKDPTQSGALVGAAPRGSEPALPRTPTSPPTRGTASNPALPRTLTSPAMRPPPNPPGARSPSAPPSSRATGGSPAVPRTATPLPRIAAPAVPPAGPDDAALVAALAALVRTTAIDQATDVAMAYAAGRFDHAVLFAINEGAAMGDRGHGGPLTDETIHAIAVPLSAPSIVQVAYDTRQLATAAPVTAGRIQDRLTRTLGNPPVMAAMPIEVDRRIAYVIAVGDGTDRDAVASHLAQLGDGLAAAYQRLTGRPPGR